MKPYKMKVTAQEQETLDWCVLALTDEQIAECEAEANEIAAIELHQAEAAELLVRTLAQIQIRNVRAEMNGKTAESEPDEEDAEDAEEVEEAAADEAVDASGPQQRVETIANSTA